MRSLALPDQRVIEQTIRQKLPEGFQRSEFLLEHGMLDAVVPRRDMKSYLVRALDFMQPDSAKETSVEIAANSNSLA